MSQLLVGVIAVTWWLHTNYSTNPTVVWAFVVTRTPRLLPRPTTISVELFPQGPLSSNVVVLAPNPWRFFWSQRPLATQLSAVRKKKSKTSATTPKTTTTTGGFGRTNAESLGTAAPSSSVGPSISGHSGSGVKALRKAANTFDRIRKENAHASVQTVCRDVYVRSPLNSPTTFWFVGKIARQGTLPSLASNDTHVDDDNEYFCQAAVVQKRLILEYAKDQLRPQNMGGRYASTLELWLAPGDSEMDVATNKVNLTHVSGSIATYFSSSYNETEPFVVGYNPEIYVGEEVTKGGLRVERNEQGETTKPPYDVNEGK